MPGGRHKAELASPLTTAVHERQQARHLLRRDRESKRPLWWCPRRNYRTRHSGPSSGNIKKHWRSRAVRCLYSVPLTQEPGANSLQSPSETTSTLPSITLTALSSSSAYMGTGIPEAHFSTSADVLNPSRSTCTVTAKSTSPSALSPSRATSLPAGIH